MIKKILTLIFAAAMTVFFGCSGKNSQTAGSQSSESDIISFTIDDLPQHWFRLDGRINLTINVNWKDKTKGEYQLWCGSGSAFASGVYHYSDSGTSAKKFTATLELLPPEEEDIDFTRSTGSDSEKQSMLDYMFPDGKKCVIEDKSDYTNLSKKGAFVYRDTAFFDSKYTVTLPPESKTTVEGLPGVYLGRKSYTPKAKTCAYSKPDVKSEKVTVDNIRWSNFSGDRKVTVLSAENPFWYRGMLFNADARTEKKYTVNGVKDYWYYAQFSKKSCWIFGGDLEPYDDSLVEEYGNFMIESAVKDGLIQVTDIDFSKYPTKFGCFSIGEDEDPELFYSDDAIFLAFRYRGVFARYDRNLMAADSDGFVKFRYGPGENDRYLFIIGDQIKQYFTNFQNDGSIPYSDLEDDDAEGMYHNYYFKDISASSSLSENIGGRKITYSPKNLEKCFIVGCRCHPYWWNYSHIPWVEGAAGNGIGESITIEFTEAMAGMSVLNGYTDLNKLKLFKENSCLKQVLIEDLVNGDSWTVNFDDYVYFNYIPFKQASTKVRMTIKSVYEGSKYADTCVSAIIPCKTSPLLTQRAEQEYHDYIYADFKDIVKNCQEITPQELFEKMN